MHRVLVTEAEAHKAKGTLGWRDGLSLEVTSQCGRDGRNWPVSNRKLVKNGRHPWRANEEQMALIVSLAVTRDKRNSALLTCKRYQKCQRAHSRAA